VVCNCCLLVAILRNQQILVVVVVVASIIAVVCAWCKIPFFATVSASSRGGNLTVAALLKFLCYLILVQLFFFCFFGREIMTSSSNMDKDMELIISILLSMYHPDFKDILIIRLHIFSGKARRRHKLLLPVTFRPTTHKFGLATIVVPSSFDVFTTKMLQTHKLN